MIGYEARGFLLLRRRRTKIGKGATPVVVSGQVSMFLGSNIVYKPLTALLQSIKGEERKHKAPHLFYLFSAASTCDSLPLLLLQEIYPT